jgi:hypothetical protein
MGALLSLPVLGADEKDKKSDAKKDEPAKKTDVKKDEAKKDETKKDDSKKESDKGKDAPPAEKLFKLATIRGKVIWLDEAKKKLKIRVQVTNDQNVEYEWEAIDDLKVRSVQPPMQFDEKGRARPPTRKELKELRGSDPKLPGYQADFSDLKMEQIVDVSLVTKKRPPARPPKKGALGEEYTPKMSLILIVAKPNP